MSCSLAMRFMFFTFFSTFPLASSFANTKYQGEELPLDDLRTFTDVFHQIRSGYVEEVTDSALLRFAIRGMLLGLDPHSIYMDKESFSELQTTTSGEFTGLGLEVGMEDGYIKVISPIDGSPAALAGLQHK